MLRKRGIAADEILLDDDAAANGLNRAIEDSDEAVARRLHQASMVLDDTGLDEVPLNPLDADMRAFLVGLHQAAVGSDVTDNDCCETTRHGAVRRRLVLIPGSEVANFAHCAGTPQTYKGRPTLRFREAIVCEGYHIDKLGQCRRTRDIEFQGATTLNPSGPTSD
ncbi:hypothetical protein ABIF42_007627 [Bradyrhizobium diazoefficiens]